MQHVINKQIIELTLRAGAVGVGGGLREADAAFRMQQQVSTQFFQQVLSILGRVFDALGAEGELISFDRLVIDMGAVPAENIENGSWTDDLYDKLLGKAEAIIREGGGRRTAVRRPRGAGIVEQWLSYMRTGHLPWNVVAIDQEWMQLLLEHLAADHSAVTAVREALAGNPVVLRRVAWQHGEQFLINLVEVLTARNQSALPAALGEVAVLLQVMSGKVPLAGDVRTLWMGALRLAAEVGVERSTAEIIRALLLRVALLPAEISVVRDRLAGRLSICEPLLEDLAASHRARGAEVVRDGQIEGAAVDSPTRSVKDIAGVPEAEAADAEQRVTEEGIFVPDAGLVLLHPFLSVFFTRVGLANEGEFIDQAAQFRALHLLHYIGTGEMAAGTGEMAAPEYALVMAKVLCGVPLEEPVPMEFEPTPAEVEEGDALLDACISQWKVLQNTSRAGLRESFLNRSGKLYRKDDRLRLEVEQSSIDVLLDHLPWNLSLVKLPWMKEILYVNWR
jgi:hypothetical protein